MKWPHELNVESTQCGVFYGCADDGFRMPPNSFTLCGVNYFKKVPFCPTCGNKTQLWAFVQGAAYNNDHVWEIQE